MQWYNTRMGRSVNTNLNISYMGQQPYDENVLKSLVKTNPLVLFDNIPCKSYYPLFDDEHFEEGKIPLMIKYSWAMGGGPASPDFLSFFSDRSSALYLPTLVISGIIGNLAYDLAKKVFSIFKKKLPRKRLPLIYYSEKEEVTYYEFPSESTIKDFEEGVGEIKRTAEKATPQSHFVRSLREKKWILEE